MLIHNPVITELLRSADPFVTYDGEYYYSCYAPGKDGVVVTRFTSLSEIADAEKKVVYDGNAAGAMHTAWYAPEMHKIGNRWYIYAAPGCADNPDCHSMHVLRSKTDDAFGEYEFCGNMNGLNGCWAIDGTVFFHNEKMYTALSLGGITLAEMPDPLTVGEKRTVITTCDRDWEQVMSPVVEGPAVLKKGKYIHIIYSASDSRSDDYCLGLLTYAGGDIMDAKSWHKSEAPVFCKTEGIYGPGHCSFTKTPAGNDVVVYHANLESSSGWYGRSVWMKQISWENDYPVFGKPEFDTEIL